MEFFWFFFLWFLLLVVIAAWPTWPHARTRGWGYYPSGAAAGLLILLLILIWFGVLAVWWPWVAVEPV